ncbi:sugar transporter SWEET1-like isoform X1 [Daphnia pulex]|uniref:sugar transporter SWEET1-like isoform X1 n=1 Tax=Daphnia pulex TaxID=6669 RepID=UPI001EE1436B|nr:sugar transporter SWEET1-like isoform X1 [Daphnia pulex]XP_046655527.1 sugar transporter SWEET1-like isoform X1 [Daphnia pulicaria]
MALENFREILSVTATITTIIQFLTGVIICLSIRRKGGSGDISGFPFIAGVLGCSLWLRYGMLMKDTAMTVVNAVGLVLQLCYVFMYYLYATNKGPYLKQVVIVFSVILSTMLYVAVEPIEDKAEFRLGLLCCATTLIFCSAPLATLGDVLRTRSTETLPFYLILANVLVAAQWFLYGVAVHNTFVQVPNFISCLIALFQLALFAFFPSTNTRTKLQVSDEE